MDLRCRRPDGSEFVIEKPTLEEVMAEAYEEFARSEEPEQPS